jgi:ribosomal protein S18 acetylase RimI-like enzyme
MIVEQGFETHERAQVAAMYWDAFGQKLGRVMDPSPRALQFIERVLDPTHALCARDDSGALLGVAGFKTFESALVGGTFGDLRRIYGTWGSLWRAGALTLLERDTETQRFLMDGIFVSDTARGRGVGTALLDAICDVARTRGYAEVRLDVIDTNPRARALYERQGFVAGEVQRLGILTHVFGFESATTMIRRV